MPHGLRTYSQVSRHPAPHGQVPHAYVRSAAAGRLPAELAGDYTFLHGGRQVRLGPVAFWIVVGTLVIMAAWSITTATYFAFHDDVLTRMVAREADMRFGYEDRIAELRAQIDRLSSRQLLDQEQYEQKLDQVSRRQATLESRAAALGALSDPSVTGSIKLPTVHSATPPHGAPAKPSPLGDASPAADPATRRLALDGDIGDRLAGLQASLDRVEARHRAMLTSLEEAYRSKAQRMRGVLADLGLDAKKIAPASAKADRGVGGPFVALPPFSATNFDKQLYSVKSARAEVEQLSHSLVSLPLHKPITGETDVVSGFGPRIDPFLSKPAMHTGLDLRAEIGDPVLATGSGTVTIAGWTGGYGKMVEIDHGNGFATRYGHMSEIDVKVGEQVKLGETLGKAGTTGRSTGPHLHYETRIDGEPVDPTKFLNAGSKLADQL